jgi:acyl dehydratase
LAAFADLFVFARNQSSEKAGSRNDAKFRQDTQKMLLADSLGGLMATRVIEGIKELKALIGQEVAASDWVEVTQSRINDFADATDDHQWIHIDVERAKTDSPFHSTIAHGFLTLSLLPHLAAQALTVQGDFKMGINYGLNRLRFVSPVPSGSRIRARFTLQSVEDVAGGIQITWSVICDTEGGKKPALVAEWLVRYYD